MSEGRSSTFEVYYYRGWVFLRVDPAAAASGKVYPEDIENRMRVIGMPKAPAGAIREIIRGAAGSAGAAESTGATRGTKTAGSAGAAGSTGATRGTKTAGSAGAAGSTGATRGTKTAGEADATKTAGEAARLVPWPDGDRLAATFDVTIADDEMSAAVTIGAPKRGAAAPAVDDVVEALENAGVVFGTDREEIGKAIAQRRYAVPIIAATGREPVFGRSRQLEYRFNTNRGKPYLEMPFGRINLKELNFIDNRNEGDLLAVLLPPVRAVDGSTVTGTRIPAETDVTEAVIPAGENTRLNTEKTELYAGIGGNVRFRDGLVIVEPVVEVDEVSYATGNIHFDGSVVVNGGVADGFVVEATGNIQVSKSVGRATLRAGENILLQSGMNGNGEGHLECGGNLFARYLESCSVRCSGTVLVEEAIMHSSVVVRHHCLLNGRRAEFIAGSCVVGGSFWVRKLGNMYDAATTVAVGVPPATWEEYQQGIHDLATTEETIEGLIGKVERLETAIRDGHKEGKYLTARDQLQGELGELRSRAIELRRNVGAMKEGIVPNHESVVVIEDVMFNGSKVFFGTKEYRPPHTGSHKTVLSLSHGEIHAGGYDAHDPPIIAFEEPKIEGDGTDRG